VSSQPLLSAVPLPAGALKWSWSDLGSGEFPVVQGRESVLWARWRSGGERPVVDYSVSYTYYFANERRNEVAHRGVDVD
jgi:hypothetical protein